MIALLFFGGMGGLLRAHPGSLTAAVAKIQRDGACTVDVTFDVLAFALNDTPDRMPDAPMNALLDGPPAELERRLAEARRHFARHLAIVADGAPIAVTLTQFPSAADVERWAADKAGPRLPVLLTASAAGQLPAGTRGVSVSLPEVIGNVVFTIERPGEEPASQPLAAGETSAAWELHLSAPLVGVAGVPRPRSDATVRRPLGRPATTPSPELDSAVGRGLRPPPPAETRRGTVSPPYNQSISWLTSFLGFVRLGFEHIVPRGLDHVLFVLGLFLLGSRISTLLAQVTAFTLAHSVTLALSLYGVVRLPAHVIEPLIAFSIVLVAVDNLRGGELRWWRVAVVFGFGLVHGLGFAGALREMALPRSEFLRALVGFNLGVEFGQLAVVAAAFLAVGWFRARPSYRRFIVAPASTAIAAVALVWTVQRLGGT